jgi:1-aminocyclopropane-1-carboxylate deaminase/D-cysteine desulfhydrase-like pyridoxal-dependent ACC family enzyme
MIKPPSEPRPPKDPARPARTKAVRPDARPIRPDIDSLFRYETPIEEHLLAGRRIFVKRDDLFGRFPAPPLAKLRGLKRLIERRSADGIHTYGCWDTHFSKLGQGVAAICAATPGLKAIVSYPVSNKRDRPQAIIQAEHLGAVLLPVPSNHIAICYAIARKQIEALGGYMLPFGLECSEAVEAIADTAQKVDETVYEGGTIVLSCGSGVTLAGLVKGLRARPNRVIGLSSGRSVAAIIACLRRHCASLPPHLTVLPATLPYAHALAHPCPFPAHPNYDLKAWQYLEENLPGFRDPILFWNIGA